MFFLPLYWSTEDFLSSQNRVNLRALRRVDGDSDGPRGRAELQKDVDEPVVLEAHLFALDCVYVHAKVVVRRAAEVDQGDEAGEGGNGD
jgi:hypothetical protein